MIEDVNYYSVCFFFVLFFFYYEFTNLPFFTFSHNFFLFNFHLHIILFIIFHSLSPLPTLFLPLIFSLRFLFLISHIFILLLLTQYLISPIFIILPSPLSAPFPSHFFHYPPFSLFRQSFFPFIIPPLPFPPRIVLFLPVSFIILSLSPPHKR